jgi:2,3-bisphosphoglycerate-dependent phosphoglycerate mutase
MKLFVARHGETEWNLLGREMGHLDSSLTDRGLRQAEALARRLAGLGIDRVYASDLERARRTAEIIAAACKVDLLVDPALRERNMGIFQGLTRAEIMERFPEEHRAFGTGDVEYVIPEGESARQRTDRSVTALTGIAMRHPDGRIAVVTHAGFLLGFFQHVLAMSPGESWRFRRHNASLSVFGYRDRRWHLESWNDTSHLDRLGSLDDPMISEPG